MMKARRGNVDVYSDIRVCVIRGGLFFLALGSLFIALEPLYLCTRLLPLLEQIENTHTIPLTLHIFNTEERTNSE